MCGVSTITVVPGLWAEKETLCSSQELVFYSPPPLSNAHLVGNACVPLTFASSPHYRFSISPCLALFWLPLLVQTPCHGHVSSEFLLLAVTNYPTLWESDQ